MPLSGNKVSNSIGELYTELDEIDAVLTGV
jgi:hypothetical protein